MSRALENRKFGESLEKTLKKISKDCIPPTSLSMLQIGVLLDISQSLAIIADNLAREDEQMNDLISRQAAIRWVKTECNPYGKPTLEFESGKKVIEHLEQMPSAQPEIIRCKDCRYRKFVDFGMGDCLHPSGCRGIAFDNHFCALGERREDQDA